MQGYWAAGKFEGSGTLVFMLGDYQAKYDGSWLQGNQVSNIGFSCYLLVTPGFPFHSIGLLKVFSWFSHQFLIGFSLVSLWFLIGFSLVSHWSLLVFSFGYFAI